MRKNTPTQNPTLADLYTEIKAVKTEVHEINTKVSNLDNKVISLDEKFISLNNKVTNLDEKFIELDKKIDRVGHNIITEFSGQIRDVLELVDKRLQPLETTKVRA